MKKAYAIIIRNGLILLVRRPGMPIWDLPGGDLLSNEKERDGMRRLIKEMLSFESTVEDLIGIYTKEYHEEITYVYKVQETVSQSPMESQDYAAFNFFDIHNLPLNIFPDRHRQIRDYLTGRYPVRWRFKRNTWLVRIEKFINKRKK
ncbi:NUDIX domain-containing protein [Enterococcus dongliensis]|uniref:NUDIX domain-containing protein n=1 Tax=Enterococcus dongliensis TaxID=2559925 RepID=A0AAP5NL25_9ENTE|nr:NUDIX domain-containing protein [Enterococcus dongliensis]MDT2596251.1 NUDIX domain-containing protein [Enterococcus dongliensis]MDT2604619.1 NUDIX domain-containing protein [Enterococcus dongliensis]MDT2613006.1 NUDIX domain-containing protein [Enterococcus dongliensis]MDT2634830.1 NUDIX domain-containing protein [Enterococcus dongliensis]MDT2637873.1 NUDIX domain-containing protein [Enterococcus dongliensis]